MHDRSDNISICSAEEATPLIGEPVKANSMKKTLALVAAICGIGALAVFGVWYGASGSSSKEVDVVLSNSIDFDPLLKHWPIRRRNESSFSLDLNDSEIVEQFARDILRRVPLIDGHNDLPMKIRYEVDNEVSEYELLVNGSGQTSIPKLQAGMLGGQFWSIYVGCSSQYKDAVQYAFEQIDLVKNMVRKYPRTFQLATSVNEIVAAFRNGKIASLMGVEGGHMMGESLAVLRQLYELGARYMTLTHNCNTPWADNSRPETDDQTPQNDGITDWGKLVIAEMNRLGMLVDLSHVSQKVMEDVLNVTKAPIIFSHSSAYAVCPHPRNVPDDILLRVKLNGGIVMVNFNPQFVNCNEENALDGDTRPATLEQVADHIEHIAAVAGVESVGIGSDFDGIMVGPEGLEDVSKFPDLMAEMLLRGWSVEEVEALAGRNLLRVFKQVEKFSRELEEGDPIETPINYDDIPKQECRGTPVTD